MAKSRQEVVFEGWLTKSPPTKRMWRARWRRRWFSLTHSGEIPNQFVLMYYADRNYRKLKGFINLDDCEQVDLGLKLHERKLKFDHVFDIKTPTRTYYLAADSESEMKSWVNYICKVCSLKSTTDEDDIHISDNGVDVDIVYSEEKDDRSEVPNLNETPPISPVSTSPYIPISECITGKTPILDPQDIKLLIEQNLKNTMYKSKPNQTHINQTYGVGQSYYLNCVNDMQDPRFYDCPRVLAPKNDETNTLNKKDKNSSPLQSPTDSESVFTDDDSAVLDVYVTQRFTKSEAIELLAPPRPPKSSHVVPSNYMNLSTPRNDQDSGKEDKKETPVATDSHKIITTDDMYDFPRSHQVEAEAVRNLLARRHCYNNAAPGKIEDQIFRYDISPKPSTSVSQVFRYDLEDLQDEPASPHSQTSSTTPYSNLPSPLLGDNQLMPPPMVNRDLKPKRKLSDSLSSSSNPEPSSPRGAPSVDRKLKPPTPLQDIRKFKASPTLSQTRKTLSVDEDCRKFKGNPSPVYVQFNRKGEDEGRKIRAAPSPTPPGSARSFESLLSQNNQEEQIYHYLPGKMQYLDLDLDCGPSNNTVSTTTATPPKACATNTVYKKVDFEKTQAFNITRNNLERERKEPVTFLKK